MFTFIDNYSFFPVSGCEGMGPSEPLCPGVYGVAKTVLSACIMRISLGSCPLVYSDLEHD